MWLATSSCTVTGLEGPGRGNSEAMFVYRKRSGRPGKVQFYWWPLIVGLVLSVLLTLLLNAR